MNNRLLKWILLLAYLMFAIWFGWSFECHQDTARPMILSLSFAYIVNLNINFFLRLPMNVLHIPEVRNVSNFRKRRHVILVTWLMFLAAIIWGLVDEFGCSV